MSSSPGTTSARSVITLRELIYDVAGGIADGRELKAVIPGGSSVPVLTPAEIDTPMDYDSIQAAGSFFGSAAIIVVDDRCCMVQLALRAAQFYMHESCGKCTPCRVGTRWLVQLLTKIEEGRGETSPTSSSSTTSATECSGKNALCARRLRRLRGLGLRTEVPRRVRGTRPSRALPVRRGELDRGHLRSHRPTRSPAPCRTGECVKRQATQCHKGMCV